MSVTMAALLLMFSQINLNRFNDDTHYNRVFTLPIYVI